MNTGSLCRDAVKVEDLSARLLLEIHDAVDGEELELALTWSESRALSLELFAVGEVDDRGLRWALVVVASRYEETVRWWEFRATQAGARVMRGLLLLDVLRGIGAARKRSTPGRPFNAVRVVGTC